MDKVVKNEEEIKFLISPEEYRSGAIETMKKINSPEILKLVYYFVKSGHKEERAGRK